MRVQIIDNKHIDSPDIPLSEYLRQNHPLTEVQQRLRMNRIDLYDGSSEDIDDEVTSFALQQSKNPVYFTEKDKLKDIIESMKQIDSADGK